MAKSKQPRFRRLKAFGTAFCLTLCLLGWARVSGGGLQHPKGNLRGGGGAPGHSCAGAPGRTALTEEEEAWAGRVWTILPARWRAAAWLTEAERDFAPSFLDMVNQELRR